VTYWNPAAEALFGHETGEAIGRAAGLTSHPDDATRSDVGTATVDFVGKPYSVRELLYAVRTALDRVQAAG
jgi:PAS domain-containing protein